MAHASIPVDLFNPGQVFACLGFLEAADVLLGDAEGGFDWSDETNTRFQLHTAGHEGPFRAVLRFLAEAQLQRVAPAGYVDPAPEWKPGKKTPDRKTAENDSGDSTLNDGPLVTEGCFPGAEADWRTLAVRLTQAGHHLDLSHWADSSSRNDFKLFAGQQRGPAIARAMLAGIAGLWRNCESELVRDPFGITTGMGGSSFKFDARKSWTAIDAGYSPDEQKDLVMASPVVEFLAAAGLEHARPNEFQTRKVRYGVWTCLIPPPLARPASSGVDVGIPRRRFRFTLALAGKNKIITSAEEETNQ